MRAADFAQRVRGAQLRGDQWSAFCPAHNDEHNRSLSFRDGDRGVIVTCFAGCSVEAITAACGVTVRDLFYDAEASMNSATRNGQARRVMATYDYLDESEALQFQVERFEPKGFRQRRPDGRGGWVWDLQDVRRVLYRLPAILANPTQPITFHEGERAVEAAVEAGLPGCHTTTSGGANNGHLTDLSPCTGRDVVVCPDNDAPGQRYADTLAVRLHEVGARSVRIVRWPNVPSKGDVVEWLQQGGTPEEFAALLSEAAPINFRSNADGPVRAELNCDVDDLDALTKEAFRLVEQANQPPLIYRRGTIVVRTEVDEQGRVRLVELTPERLRYHVANTIRCVKAKRSMFGGRAQAAEDCKPPMDVIRNMLSVPGAEMPLPYLRGIVETPVLSRGEILVQLPGYDVHSQLLYRPFDASVDLRVPVSPTQDEVAASRACIDEVLLDFPFASHADRTHAVALLILPFVRPSIQGPTPLHLFEAPSPGSGKTLLVDILLSPSVGGNVGTIADARDEDEMRKRITARLLEGCPVTLFDNVVRPLDSGVISAALTALQWEDRRLGKTETLRVPVETIWAMTANNPTLSLELARRTVRIRLDPRLDRPWTRDGFRHPNLRQWVKQERPALVRAVLTLVAGWLQAGRPGPRATPLGSFEQWSQVVGGVVAFAGYPDFLGNAADLYEVADTDGATWRTFTAQWWASHQDQPASVKDLFTIAEDLDGLYLGKAANERGQRSALGRQLKKRRDQVIGPYRIEEAGAANNAALWRLRRIGPFPAETLATAHHARSTNPTSEEVPVVTLD